MRVVFLDIDGPMIPEACYYFDPMCSIRRTVMSNTSVFLVNKLLEVSGAKLVTNSAHNYHVTDTGDLKADLVRHGINDKHFHDNWRTDYPNLSRWQAVQKWLRENEVKEWVGFDDEKFTTEKQLQHVDFNEGITYKNFLGALSVFKVRPPRGSI